MQKSPAKVCPWEKKEDSVGTLWFSTIDLKIPEAYDYLVFRATTGAQDISQTG